jgi:hypothetical protein
MCKIGNNKIEKLILISLHEFVLVTEFKNVLGKYNVFLNADVPKNENQYNKIIFLVKRQ